MYIFCDVADSSKWRCAIVQAEGDPLCDCALCGPATRDWIRSIVSSLLHRSSGFVIVRSDAFVQSVLYCTSLASSCVLSADLCTPTISSLRQGVVS